MVAGIISAVVKCGRRQQARESVGLAKEISKLWQQGWVAVTDVKSLIIEMSTLPLIRG